MRADLELLARLLVDVRRAVDGEALDLGRQRDGPAHPRARPLGRVDDLPRAAVEHAVIERLEADADVLAVHRSRARIPASAALLHDLCDDAGADGAAALADGEPQPL